MENYNGVVLKKAQEAGTMKKSIKFLQRVLTGLLAMTMIVTMLPSQTYAEEFTPVWEDEPVADTDAIFQDLTEEVTEEMSEPEGTSQQENAPDDMLIDPAWEAEEADTDLTEVEPDDIMYPEEDYTDEEEITEEAEEAEELLGASELLLAEEGEEPETDIKWSYSDDGTLTISGSGAIRDYYKSGTSPTVDDRPWLSYRNQATKLVIGEGITRIGHRAFQNFQKLKIASLPDSLQSIGEWSFQNCYELADVSMPDEITLENGAFRSAPFEEDATAVENDVYKSSSYYKALIQTELTGNYRDDVIAIARSQIGYHEGNSEADYGGGNTNGNDDFSEYGRFLGSSGNAWCSEFASWCIRMAGVPTSLVNSSKGANANTFTTGTSAAYHPWSETVWGGGSYTPGKGDVILWVWTGSSVTYAYDSSLSHTTLLESVDDNGSSITFNVVHGNSGGAVGAGKYVVNKADGKLTNGNGYVGYFVAPDYEKGDVVKCTVTFNANGGTITGQTRKRVSEGGMYGPLPLAAKGGQEFLGWFNENGKRIKMYSPCRLDSNETLTARWRQEGECPVPLAYLRPGAVASSVKVFDKTMAEKELGTNAYGQLYSYLADGKQYVALYVYGKENNAVLNNEGIISDSLYGKVAKNTVTDIIMDDHISKIDGDYYFQEMSKVTYVRLSENLTKMGGGCFDGCVSLPEITIPKKLETVSAMGTFAHCQALKKVTFEQGIKTIPDYICQVNSETSSGHIETVLIPPSVTEIGAKAFDGQKDLTTVIFTEPAKTTLARIGDSAFKGTYLSGIVLPSFGGTWTDPALPTWKMDPVIEANAFAGIGNKSFTTLVIPEGVKKLGNLTPGNSSYFKEIYLPKSLVKDGFYNVFVGLHYMDTFGVLKIYYPGTEAEFFNKYGATKKSLLEYGNEWVNKLVFGTASPLPVSSITADTVSIVKIYEDMTGSVSVPVALSILPAKHLETEYVVNTTDSSVATGTLSKEEDGKMTLNLTVKKKIGNATVTVSGGSGSTRIYVTVKEKDRAQTPYVSVVSGNGKGFGDLIALRAKTTNAQIFYVVDDNKSTTVFNSPDDVIGWDTASNRYQVKAKYKDQVKEFTQPLLLGTDIRNAQYLYAVAIGKDLNFSGIMTYQSQYAEVNPWGEIASEDIESEFGSKPVSFTDDYSGLWVPDAQLKDKNLVYTGKAVTIPNLRVYYGTKLLKSGSDYTLKYANNVNVSSESKKATFTVNLKGNYSGKKEFAFKVNPYPITKNDIVCSYTEVKEKKSKGVSVPQKPDPMIKVKATGKILKPGIDYKLEYKKDGDWSSEVSEPGKYEVRISNLANSNYDFGDSGLEMGTLVYCLGADNVSMSKVTVSSIPAQDITGWAEDNYQVKPTDFTVTYKGQPLKQGVDYEILEYSGNNAVGKASVVLLGQGDTYYGAKTVSFQIKGIAFNKTNIKIEGIESNYPYTGKAVVPKYQIKYGTDGLTENVDYTVSYAKNGNVNAGTVNMTFKGIGRFTGSLKASYKITPVAASSVSVLDKKGAPWIGSTEKYDYLKKGAQPDFSCKYEEATLAAGKDYNVKYSNNTTVADFNAMKGKKVVGPSFTITFKGNYTGKVTHYFSIQRVSIDTLDMSLEDMVYTNVPNKYARNPVITDANGTILKAGTDYKKDFTYTYATDTKEVMVVTGKGKNAVRQKIDRLAGEKVEATDILPVGALIQVSVEGINNYSGKIDQTFTVAPNSVKMLKFAVSRTYGYTGSPVTPTKNDITIQVKNGNKYQDVENASDYYDIIGYSNNVKKGTGKIIVKAKNGYAGTTTLTFKIVSSELLNS